MFRHGWEWFECKVNFLDIDINSDRTLINTQLAVVKPDGSRYTCEGRLVKDESKTIQLKGSCDATNSYEFIKYCVSHINFTIERKITEKVLVNYPHKKAS